MRARAFTGGLALALASLIAAGAAHAATSLDDLLEQTRTVRDRAAKENEERERQFLANRDQQAALLADAQRARDAAEAHSKQLSARFDANEV
jgi:biopolymer transport protein ExbB